MLEEEARKQCKRGAGDLRLAAGGESRILADILAMEDVVLLELSYQDALPLSRTAPNLWCTLVGQEPAGDELTGYNRMTSAGCAPSEWRLGPRERCSGERTRGGGRGV
eukprot:766718-Hanusia_phi.AAC.7